MKFNSQKYFFNFLTGVFVLILFLNIPVFSQNSEWKIRPSFVAEARLYPELKHFSTEVSPFNPQNENYGMTYSDSKRKAIFMSLLIPGWGEYYAGRKTRAKSFFITELILWSTYAGFKIYENWIEDEFIVFAETHAQAQPEGKRHKYYVNLGNYDNIYEYNAAKLNYRSLDDVYPETPEYYWQWDSPANKHDFKMMRIRADNANYRALFSLGLILVNHVVSAVDAVWVTRNQNEGITEKPLKIHFSSGPKIHEYRVVLSRQF
jgi:hypothetical protein